MILTQSVMINTVPVSDANSDTQQYVSGVTAEVTMLWYHYHSYIRVLIMTLWANFVYTE